jgi:hypothetical protein
VGSFGDDVADQSIERTLRFLFPVLRPVLFHKLRDEDRLVRVLFTRLCALAKVTGDPELGVRHFLTTLADPASLSTGFLQVQVVGVQQHALRLSGNTASLRWTFFFTGAACTLTSR